MLISAQTKKPAALDGRPLSNSDLSQLDAVGSRALLARLDLEAHALATGERVEVHARVQTGPVEEVLPTVLSRDEAEPSIGYKLLDGACRHLELLFSKVRHERTGPFEKNRRPRRTSPPRATRLIYHAVQRLPFRSPGAQLRPELRLHPRS